jgi:hypothetical protein
MFIVRLIILNNLNYFLIHSMLCHPSSQHILSITSSNSRLIKRMV